MKSKKWLNPTPEMLKTKEFKAVWGAIKTWDINVPEFYEGYCGTTGNHVRAILDSFDKVEQLEVPDLTREDFKRIIDDWEYEHSIPITDDEIGFLVDVIMKAQKEKCNAIS